MALRLGLDKITGVVMANQWADLDNTSVLAEGKTRLLAADNTPYTVDYDTELDDIGESRTVYIRNDKTVPDIADSGLNDVKDNEGVKKTIDGLKGSIKVDETTQHFSNFAESSRDYSDWIIRYVIEAGVVSNGVYTMADWHRSTSSSYNSGWVNYLTGNNKLYVGRLPYGATRNASVEISYNKSANGSDNLDQPLKYIVTIQPDTIINTYDKAIMQQIFYTADRLGINHDDAVINW